MENLSKQEMEVYLKLCDWVKVNNDEIFTRSDRVWKRKPHSGFLWNTSEAFRIQMRLDGQLDKLNPQ